MNLMGRADEIITWYSLVDIREHTSNVNTLQNTFTTFNHFSILQLYQKEYS
jgi:hypothetical protein